MIKWHADCVIDRMLQVSGSRAVWAQSGVCRSSVVTIARGSAPRPSPGRERLQFKIRSTASTKRMLRSHRCQVERCLSQTSFYFLMTVLALVATQAFLLSRRAGLLSSAGVRAPPHGSGSSHRGAWAPDEHAVCAACRLGCCSSQALEHRLSGCGAQA